MTSSEFQKNSLAFASGLPAVQTSENVVVRGSLTKCSMKVLFPVPGFRETQKRLSPFAPDSQSVSISQPLGINF